MLDWVERHLWVCAVAIVVLCLGFGAWQGHKQRKAEDAMAAANTAQGAVAVYTQEAVTHDHEAETQKPQAIVNASETKRLKTELAALRERLAVSETRPASPDAPIPDLQPILDKQSELISAQETQIKGLDLQVSTLTLARDSWRNAAQESQKESVQLRAVIVAKDGLIRGALWTGRVQGLAVGIGSGYLAGRLK